MRKLVIVAIAVFAALITAYKYFWTKPIDLFFNQALLTSEVVERGEILAAGSFTRDVTLCGANPNDNPSYDGSGTIWATDAHGLEPWRFEPNGRHANRFYFVGGCLEVAKGNRFEIRVWEVFNPENRYGFSVAADLPMNWEDWFPSQ